MNRKGLLRDDLLSKHIGYGNLCRRDEEEILLRDIEHVLFELRQLSCSCHRGAVHHERRQDLKIILVYGVKVQHKVFNCSFKSGAKSLIDGESGTCDLAGSFPVKDVQVCSDVPVSLGLKFKGRGLHELSDFHVV